MLFLTETKSYFYMCWRLTRGKDKAVLESKISRMLCRKALAYAGMPSFYGFAYEKFTALQNCFAPESEPNALDFRCGGRRWAVAHQGQQAEKGRIRPLIRRFVLTTGQPMLNSRAFGCFRACQNAD